MTTRFELFPGTDPTSTAHRQFDWSTTSLGPVESWPDSLVTAIRTVLPSRVGMLIWWGPELVQIFNDAFTPMAGELFPNAVGQRAAECWGIAWNELGPLADEALRGTAIHRTREPVLLDRYGYLEESFFTFSYSPIFGAGGVVDGVFVNTTDVTEQVLTERRMAVLRDLGTATVASNGIDDVCRASITSLSRADADIAYAAIHLNPLGEERDSASFRSPEPNNVDTGAIDTGAIDTGAIDTGAIDRVLDPAVVSRVLDTGRAESIDIGLDTALILPLRRSSDESAGVLEIGIGKFRRLDDSYRVFLELVASRISTALSDAFFYAAERRRAKDLEELDAAKTRFFENVSHEFRTPLTLLLGPLGAVLDDRDTPLDPSHVAPLQAGRRAALRLQRLVDTLLDVARGDAGEFDMHLEPTDIVALTSECVALFQDATDRAELALVTDTSRIGHRHVQVDRTMWSHIVMNLVSNAVKFTREGTITVTLAETDDHVVLTVSDTGPGIDPSDRGKIFDRFYQAPSATGRSREGSGVGLSLVSDLIVALGGSISVEGNSPRGTSFVVELPRLVSETLQPVDGSTTEVVAAIGAGYIGEADTWRGVDRRVTEPAAGQRTVVLIEDNADMRDYLVGLLEEQQWHVAVFTDVDTALDHARSHPPDAIVSDIMLPGRTGLAMVDEARSDGRLVRVPIVLLSARAGSEAVVEGLRLGADDYVVKPFQPSELIARVRVHLELARLREQLLGSAEREVSSLRTALDSRSILSQAVGVLMVTERLTPAAAFDHIASMSQAANVKARVLAEKVVENFVRSLEQETETDESGSER
ncbi:MAG: ATP-binding protein [Rhodococcus sp. (in: high G+C Gram-positive bacteria)]